MADLTTHHGLIIFDTKNHKVEDIKAVGSKSLLVCCRAAFRVRSMAVHVASVTISRLKNKRSKVQTTSVSWWKQDKRKLPKVEK